MAEIAEKLREMGRHVTLSVKNIQLAVNAMETYADQRKADSKEKNESGSTIDSEKKMDDGVNLHEIRRRLTLSGQSLQNLQMSAEALLWLITDHLSHGSEQVKQVFVTANLSGKLHDISRGMTLSAISLENAAVVVLKPDQLNRQPHEEKNDEGFKDSQKMKDAIIMAEIGKQLREISHELRLAALKLQKASEALNPDQFTQESEKNADGKRGQDQLSDGEYEIYHSARVMSSDLVGRSVADQRQTTQVEWGLMSPGAKQCFSGQEALEEELNPAKKIRLDG